MNHILSPVDPTELDVHQLNCTYYSALDGDDDLYVAARAIQLFARGVPQIYYVGLLAGENDLASGRRDRRRTRHQPPRLHNRDELHHALNRPVVKRLIELIRLRNTHPAFDGSLHVENSNGHALHMHWRHGHIVHAPGRPRTGGSTSTLEIAPGIVSVVGEEPAMTSTLLR